MPENDRALTPKDVLNIQPLSEAEFQRFKKLIYEWAGINLSEAKKALVAGRLMKRLRYYKLTRYRDYLELVLKGEIKEEKQTMIDLLTTNETYFFREPKHFDFLKDYAVPQREKGETFRVWSAACSSGEEAYSIAMVLSENIGANGWEVFGSDINNQVVNEAREAIYPLIDAEDIPREYLVKYCLKGVRTQEGKFSIVDSLKRHVSFKQINLNTDLPSDIGRFDIIFLRNVMIYFDKETKSAIVGRLIDKLKTGGYLIVGHAESLHGVSDRVRTVVPTVYTKI